jgi:periplasmic protein TonB
MSRVLAPSPTLNLQGFMDYLRSDKLVAVGTAVLLHMMVLALLLAGWQENKPIAAKIKTIKVQMIQAPVAAPMIEKVPEQPLIQAQPEPPVIAPKPIKKEPPVQAINEAKFAKKRVDEPVIEVAESIPEIVTESEMPPSEDERLSVKNQADSSTKADAEALTSALARSPSNQQFDSSQYFPVQKDAPTYPPRALDKGIQGSCTVRYTVNTEGRVENPEVLDDCHAYFIKPSLAATKSFRYTPRVVDGKAVMVPNVKNTFQYRIE